MPSPLILGLAMAAIAFAVGYSTSGPIPAAVGAAVAFVVVWGLGTLLLRKKPPQG